MIEVELNGAKSLKVKVTKYGRSSIFIIDRLTRTTIIRSKIKHAIFTLRRNLLSRLKDYQSKSNLQVRLSDANKEISELKDALARKQKTVTNQQQTIITLMDIKNRYIEKCDSLKKYSDDLSDWLARSAQENASLFKQIETLTNELKKKNENECSAN